MEPIPERQFNPSIYGDYGDELGGIRHTKDEVEVGGSARQVEHMQLGCEDQEVEAAASGGSHAEQTATG